MPVPANKTWFPFQLAWRYGFLKKNSDLTQFIALMAWLSICLGVAMLTLVLSVMNGFDQELRHRILALVPQASIQATDYFPIWQPFVEELESHPDVAAAAPFIHLQAMLNSDDKVQPAMVYAVELDAEKQVSDLAKYTSSEALLALDESGFSVEPGKPAPVLLGQALAKRLELEPGDVLSLIIPEPGHNGRVSPKIAIFTFVGSLASGTELDQHLAIISLKQAQKMLGIGDRIQGIRLKVNDIFMASYIASNALAASEEKNLYKDVEFYIRDWSQSHGNLYQAIAMSKKMVSLLMFLIIGVAAFNVVTCLVMIVKDKSGDIAILRTMGMTPREVQRIFTGIGMLIGVSGIALGLLLGVIFAVFIGDVFQLLQSLSGQALLDSTVYPISYLPSDIRPFDLLLIAVVTFVLCLLATWFPARRAAQVAPAQVLRYE